jgi:hypothetical protein
MLEDLVVDVPLELASIGACLPKPSLSLRTGEPITDEDFLQALGHSNCILVCITLSLVCHLRPLDTAEHIPGTSTRYSIHEHRSGMWVGSTSQRSLVSHVGEDRPAFEIIALSAWGERVRAPGEYAGEEREVFEVMMIHYPRHKRLAERFGLGWVAASASFAAGAAWKEVWLG